MPKLPINRFRVVRKGSLELGILPEVGILLHINLLLDLFDRSPGAAQALHLPVQVGKIVPEVPESHSRSDFKVARYEVICRERQYRIQRAYPVCRTALIHRWRGAVHEKVASGDTSLVGEKDVHVSHGMPGARSDDLNWVIIEVDRQPVGQCLRGGAKRRSLRGMVTRALFCLALAESIQYLERALPGKR